jgi:hypothetical protein
MATFVDASGATVHYFERARGLGRGYWQDVTAKSKGAATRAVNAANARVIKGEGNQNPYFSITGEQWNENQALFNPQCKTINMLNSKGGYVEISAGAYGGCCDPATERYHCM